MKGREIFFIASLGCLVAAFVPLFAIADQQRRTISLALFAAGIALWVIYWRSSAGLKG